MPTFSTAAQQVIHNLLYECILTLIQIRLQEEIRCIRDGGKWKDCPGGSTVEDLIRDIRDLSALYGLE